MLRITFFAPPWPKQRRESAVLPSSFQHLRFCQICDPQLQWLFRLLWPRPLAQGCRGRKQDPATPSTPSYLAFGPGGSAIEVVLLRHEVVVQRRRMTTRPEFLAPTVVELGR